jgi:chromosome segregation protein
VFLKRLTLQGFKTFADKTELVFAPGVTCIVGPNGSGKSNVLDAISWVLGEQKASSLRAARAQDVLFAGSAKRRPMGMAEVSLTVDNEDRFLPLEFGEITVTRRLYRNGDSEYLLNKVPCRLKDITDLFLDTGVGRGAYAIVNQSEIDSILSARPEDRRELFEEAAGIKKYRVKKREAQRKLENTETNLVRIRDILSELSTQVGPLAEQAELARRQRALTERLRQIEVGLLAADVKRLRDELDELQSSERDATAEAQSLRNEAEALDTSATAVAAQIDAAETEMDAARQRQQIALSRSERLESQVALATERRTGAERTLTTLDADVETLHRDQTRLQTEAQQQAQAARDAEAALAEKAAALSGAEAILRETEKALGELDRAAAGQDADYLRLAREIATRRAERDGLRAALQRREIELADAQARADERAHDAEAARDDATRLAEAAETARQSLVEVRRVLADECEPQRQKALAALAALADDRSRRERALATDEARLRVLEETEAAHEGYFAGVRAVRHAVENGRLTGRYTVVADAIAVPEALETAIEVALGASLQDIIVDTETQAKAAIRLLHESRAGRATFLPLESLRPPDVPGSLRLAARRLDGVLGSAADLVTFADDVAPAIRVLLARVLVCEDLDTATQARRDVSDWARIVTRDGELLVPSGAITGGRQSRPGPNLLSRKREIAELLGAVEAGRRDQERLATDEASLRAAENEARLAVLAAEKAVQAARDALSDAERRAQSRTHEIPRLTRDSEQARLRADQLARSQAADTEREQALTAALAQRDTQDDTAQATRAALASRRAELTARQAEVREQTRSLSAEAGALRERTTGLRRDAERARDGAVRAQVTAEERLRRADEARETIAAAIAQIAQCAAERDDVRGALDAATTQAERWRERRQALVAENFQLSERIKLALRGAQSASERAQGARLRAARVETQLETVAQRLVDEYDLHPDSALELTGGAPVDRDTAQEIGRLRREIKALGPVNTGAIEEFDRVSERHGFLDAQRSDLEEARGRLDAAIAEIDEATRGVFEDTVTQVAAAFARYFGRLFGGGTTELVLTRPDDIFETGVEILAQPPGKKRQNLALLSGGERALTATALLFAFLDVRPAPFCVLDEVDAPLDGANVEKFADLVREFGERSQFLLITHNATTMEAAPLWYGVTMQEPGVSRTLSMKVPEPVTPPADAEIVLSAGGVPAPTAPV